MSLSVVNHLTLDGVMQAPAAPDEDTTGGFTHGGWAIARNDEVMFRAMAAGMQGEGALLMGRVTYEHMASVWPKLPDDNPYAARMNASRKYVVSTSLTEPLGWNSSVVSLDEIAALKEETDLAVLGSGVLTQALLARRLVDRMTLMIHPVTLGIGKRLFPDGGAPATLQLDEAITTTTGVIIATYSA